jgi:hypothetical protein
MSGDATGVDVGGVAVGASMTTTLVDGSLSAYVGDDAKIGENSGMTVGALTVEASFTGDDVSSVYGLAGGIGALSANIATTLVDTQVDAYIGNADVSVSGDLNVLASAAPEAVADAVWRLAPPSPRRWPRLTSTPMRVAIRAPSRQTIFRLRHRASCRTAGIRQMPMPPARWADSSE